METKRRDLEKIRRRELLLDAAERVFGRKPFDEASMQEVAAEAQIGMQGLYEQFSSKQGLYESLILHRSRSFHEKMTESLAGIKDPGERLRAWARVKAETSFRMPAFLPVFLREKVRYDWGLSSRFGPAISGLYDQEHRRLRQMMDGAVKSGLLRRNDPEFLVQFFLGALEASLHHHFKRKPAEEVEPCVDRAMACFLEGAGGGR